MQVSDAGRRESSEGDKNHSPRRGAIAMIVRQNLDSVILPHTHARVGGAQINTNRSFCLGHPK
jgi:hypothetical protein